MLKINDKEFIRLADFMKLNYGIILHHKRILVEGRLGSMMADSPFEKFSDYLDFVMNDKNMDELNILINKLTTNHTFFMRETDHFEYFKEKAIPYMESVASDRDLRIWSAGSSTGEEAYTLSMIINDYFGENKSKWNSQILATDISNNVIEKAKLGIYSASAVDSLPSIWKLNYFQKIDNENYQISEGMRKDVAFGVLNLMDKQLPFRKRFHVIFCRNVMIYFDPKTKHELVERFYDMIEPGGYLFIGHSESINKEMTRFQYIKPAVYRKG